jgi:hypothetical protein
MSRITRNAKDIPTFRIELPPTQDNPGPDWVVAKVALRIGDRDQVNANIVVQDEETGLARVDTSRVNANNLLASIVEWGGPGFTSPAGSIEPIDFATVAGLDENTAAYILKAIKTRNQRPVAPKDPANEATTVTSS